jgi:serine/threonine protein kinase
MTKDDTAIILRQILKAVRYMSKKGVLHRDLKPENILITPKKEIKIIDFNLATLADEPKYLFVRCGTAGYVAPEILKIKD